jgi:DNA-binding NarL/FixJ family response regulator
MYKLHNHNEVNMIRTQVQVPPEQMKWSKFSRTTSAPESKNPTSFIHIVGMNTLQNNLLLLFLKKKIHLIGKCVQKLESARAIHENASILTQLLLLDYPSIDKNDFWERLSAWKRSIKYQSLVALCNIEYGTKLEKDALKNKIQGLFYKNDHPDIIAKGISAILKGDLWYSRMSLKKYIAEYNSSTNIPDYFDTTNLTFREKEILTMIAAGASNKTISDNFCISIHTVKTHVYNIYKKINVATRLQAGLWAAKYL